MLRDRSDDFYGARLVADARLHLGSIMNGQFSEPFFSSMCRIIHYQFYLGYKTFEGKEIKLAGIKDFLYNFNYGLGLKASTVNVFCTNCAKLSLKDKSQSRYSIKFIEWLKRQDETFDFPTDVFEFRRVCNNAREVFRGNRREIWLRINLAKKLYREHPELLTEIGPEEKYHDIVDCCDAHGLYKKPKVIPARLYNDPSEKQLERLARSLSKMLSKDQKRALIAKMIELYRVEQEKNVDHITQDA